MHASEDLGFKAVFEAELTEIRKRRRVVGLIRDEKPTQDVDGSETAASQGERSRKRKLPLVGLALSGGGIRSGSFGLGFLQAMYVRGLLRHVDYLSTVSGGGYVGSYLSSWLASAKEPIEWAPAQSPQRHSRLLLPFHPGNDGEQPAAVRTLANRGEQMKRPLRFLSRHLWGLICVNVLILSGLIAAGALAAYAFRSLDVPQVSTYISQLGFRDDISRAFFPAFVIFATWIVAVAGTAYLRKRQINPPGIATAAYALLALTTIGAIVALFSTGNLNLEMMEKDLGLPKASSDRIRTALGWLAMAFPVVFAFLVAPNLNIREIIRSGTKPRNRFEGWIFNLASHSLLLGVPFIVFYFVSAENISTWNETRPEPYSMSIGHIRDWPAFWRGLHKPENFNQLDRALQSGKFDAVVPGEIIWLWLRDVSLPGDFNPTATSDKPTAPSDKPNASSEQGESTVAGSSMRSHVSEFRSGQGAHPIEKCVVLQEWIDQQERHNWFWHRWTRLVTHLLGADDEFERRLGNAKRLTAWKAAIIEELNYECLKDPSFYRYFVTPAAMMSLTGNSNAPQVPVALPNFDPDAELRTDVLMKMDRLQRAEACARLAKRCESARIEVLRAYHRDSTEPQAVKHLKLSTVVPFPSLATTTSPLSLIELAIAEAASEAVSTASETRETSSKDEKLWNWFNKQVKDSVDDVATLENEAPLVALEKRDEFQQKLTNANNRGIELRQLRDRIERLNWNLLRAYYGPGAIYPPSEIFAFVVAEHDQQRRLEIFWASATLFLILGTCFSVNPTMLHGFYRESLGALWIVPHPRYGISIPLRKLQNCRMGGPFHILNGTLNQFGPRTRSDKDLHARFTMSQLHVGSKRTGFATSALYQMGNCDISDAMAISGAAVTPSASENAIVRALLIVFNLRLGKWMHNPCRPPGDLSWPSPLRLLWERLTSEAERRQYLYISDGGHSDNTGIGSLLQRRCRIILAVDSSQDEKYDFADLRKLLSESETLYGIRFSMVDPQHSPVSFDELRRATESGFAPRHFIVLRFQYPGSPKRRDSSVGRSSDSGSGQTGYLIYAKPTLTGDEPEQLRSYCSDTANAAFPHDPTVDQFFESERFLKYCELGRHIGETVADMLLSPGQASDDLSNPWLADSWKPVEEVPLPATSPPAAESLHHLTDLELNESTAPELFVLLRDPSPSARQVACCYLTEKGSSVPSRLRKRIISELIECLDNETDIDVRIQICNSLSSLGEHDKSVQSVLARRANDPAEHDHVRSACGLLISG